MIIPLDFHFSRGDLPFRASQSPLHLHSITNLPCAKGQVCFDVS
jgi:hypothetical protein